MSKIVVPTYDKLMNPTLKALHLLGGSGTTYEIYQKVSEYLQLSEELLSILHPGKGTQTEVDYRLAWARTYLKKYGLIESSSRGVWALTAKGQETKNVEPKSVVQYVRAISGQTQTQIDNPIATNGEDAIQKEEESQDQWKQQVLATLLQMSPGAFERLIQRVLRESGFIQVEVTGRTGDQGIDGKGIIQIGGVLSFYVLFQCKRYKTAVTSPEIRNFRGAMQGRTDKGLFVTTSSFTKDATDEAKRDGAPPIDLIDGEGLISKLKELSLGIKTVKKIVEIEEVIVEEEWFQGL